MTQPFVHLRVHSEYSILDGIVRIPAYLQHCEAHNMPVAALTDVMNLFGVVKFYKQALAKKCKPILGADIVLQVEKELSTCTLLCKNSQGYRNLIELISKAYLARNEQDQPVIQWDYLCEKNQGLLVLSGAEQETLVGLCYARTLLVHSNI